VRLLLVLLLAACGNKSSEKPAKPKDDAAVAAVADAHVALPPAPPLPAVPAGLPPLPELPNVTPEAVALGELLFFDSRLSVANSLSCAGCHDPMHNFSGHRDLNATGKTNVRRTQAIVNVAWQKEFGWDGRFTSLAEHLAAHARGQLGDDLSSAVARIKDVPGYRAYFARVGPVSGDTAITALSAYVLTRYAGDAPWDRLERAPDLPAELKAGYQLFIGKAQCAVCHTPPLYTDHAYHRLGLIATPDEGRGRVDPAKQGAFKTPTLRGASIRTRLFHDASAETLEAAIDWHLAGGTGQNADPSIVDLKKVTLSMQERVQLGWFVRALTDSLSPTTKPTLP
jgi:cytochrome c peroxidase